MNLAVPSRLNLEPLYIQVYYIFSPSTWPRGPMLISHHLLISAHFVVLIPTKACYLSWRLLLLERYNFLKAIAHINSIAVLIRPGC